MASILDFPRTEARKAIILARVSSKEQEEGHSIEAQKHRLQVYCQRKGLEVVKTFEITESSTAGDRKKFMEMIAFAKAQRQTVAIVADKVDRLQRSFREYPMLDGLIQDGRIELHFNTENYIIHKGSVSHENMMWHFSIMMAKAYTDTLSDNVVRSIDHNLRNGSYPSQAPVGYINIRTAQGKADIIQDPDRAHLVRRMFVEYAGGLCTLAELRKKTMEWGLRNRKGKQEWLSRSQIHDCLNNPFYQGTMRVNGNLYPHRYEPLIGKDIFDQCQAVMKGWNKKPFQYRGKEFLFRGLLTCGTTGRMVTADHKVKKLASGGTASWTYLRCWKPEEPAKIMYVREDKVIDQVEHALRRLTIPQEVMDWLQGYLRTLDGTEREFLRRQTAELKREYEKVQARLDGLMDLLMDGAINRGDFDRRRAGFRERQVEIEAQLASHRAGDDGFKDALLGLLELSRSAIRMWDGSQIEQKRQLAGLLFENLRLEGGKLCYDLRKPFCWFAECREVAEWLPLIDRLRTEPATRVLIIMTRGSAQAAHC